MIVCQSLKMFQFFISLRLSLCLYSEDTKNGNMVEDFVAVVRGGNSEAISALMSKNLPTPELMRLWGEGVRFNPDIIRLTVSALVEI